MIHYTAKISGGKLPLYVSEAIRDHLKTVKDDTLLQIIIKPRPRSTAQNSFYFGVAVPLVQKMFEEGGQVLSAGEAHELIFGAILKHTKIIHMPDGATQEVRMSSTELTTVEWEDKLTQLRAWCAGHGVQLSFPHERY